MLLLADPLIALVAAAILAGLCALIFWPERGLLAYWKWTRRLNERVQSEDALKHIHKCEMDGRQPTIESIAGALQIKPNATATLLATMQTNGLVSMGNGKIHLTPQGRDAALHIIRAHRLWEHYLAEKTGYSEAEWHGQAEQLEHTLTPTEVDALASQLGYPTYDPHGDPIPNATGKMVDHGGQPITALALDTPGYITHLEDEPTLIYKQLVAEGLHPGMTVRVTESTAERVRFWTNGDEHVLAPIVAANITVLPLPQEAEQGTNGSEPLTHLQLGETAEVTSLSPACRGAERRRLMDLGILPGTKIRADIRSPSGDPTAYEVRGALIALRKEQADFIAVHRMKNGSASQPVS